MRKEIERIVYGKRNKAAIYSRKLEYKFFSCINQLHHKQLVHGGGYVVVYPEIHDNSQLNDVLNRAIWSFPPNSPFKIYYASEVELEPVEIPFQHSFLHDYMNNQTGHLVKVNYQELRKMCDDAASIMVWDCRHRYDFAFSSIATKVSVVDPWYYSLEECNNMKFGLYNVMSRDQRKEFYEQTQRNYLRFKSENEHKDYSYVFVTGPSFSTYTDLHYEKNSLKIVCNRIVKDKNFLEFIGGPDIICFCDPAFHFSTNEYANTFRNLVWDCIRKYGSYIAIPQSAVPLISYNFPEVRDKIIGLRRAEKFTIPSEGNMQVKPTGSVITFMMIPLAVSLTRHVGIIGADGRGKQENYFWKHNDQVQLKELMECVYETHPSFFRDRVYADHYEHHCEEMKQMIELGESKGVEISALTHSFVPCLAERYGK